MVRNEVGPFLIMLMLCFWLDQFHADGLKGTMAVAFYDIFWIFRREEGNGNQYLWGIIENF